MTSNALSVKVRPLLSRLAGGMLVLAAMVITLYPLAGFWASVGPWRWNGLVAGSSLDAVRVSLEWTAVALVGVVVLGTPMAWFLARSRRLVRYLLEGTLLVSVLTPPLAMGLLLALAFGPSTHLGAALLALGVPTSNSVPAFVVTQIYVSLGYYVIAARSAFAQIRPELEQTAALLGLGNFAVFYRVTLPLAAPGLAAALTLAWVRALGEFGAVMVTAYYPSGMPVQLWINLQDAGLPAVLPLLLVFLLTALPLPWIAHWWARARHA